MASAIASGKDTLILERNPDAGKKLLLSGSGQCNFTNNLDKQEFLCRCGKAAPFLKPAFYHFDNFALMELLEQHGCPVLIREDGKAFPASMKASDVRDALRGLALSKGAKLVTGVKAERIVRSDRFALHTDNGKDYTCDKLILACGGASWPQTGSDGSGYALAAALGHTIKAAKPALAAVIIGGFAEFGNIAGVSVREVQASLITSSSKLRRKGDLLFTHQGLSGPLILDNSHLLSAGDRILLHLLPDAETAIPSLVAINQKASLGNALKRIRLPHSLLVAILKDKELDPRQPCSQLSRTDRNRLIQSLLNLEFIVSEVESLVTAMSTSGGVCLKEVRARSMESKLCPGLFFAGEILDYDLPSGGFNIQMAISTGVLAGVR